MSHLISGLVITWQCNLRCIHCYPYLPKDKEPTLDEIKSRIDQLKNEGYLFLNITGGEPLIRKDFFDIMSYGKKQKFALLLSTNGILLTKKMIKKLKKLNTFRVQISLFGADTSTHEYITGVKGSFNKAITAARLLKTEDVRVVFKITTMPENNQEIYKIRALARRMHIECTTSPLKLT